MSLTDPIARLRLVGMLEGTTLLLLVLVGVPLKHLAGRPELVSVMGPVHGLAFITYVVVAIEAVSGGGWRPREIARLLLACVVPFGPFLNDGWLRRLARAGRFPAATAGD